MKIHKVTDREIEICGWAMENETEGCVKLAIQMQLALLMEIRNERKKPLLQKIKEKIFGLPKVKKQKVYTTPTGNKKDIIVGGSNPLQAGYTPKPTDEKGEIKAPQGGTGESCNGCKCSDKEIIGEDTEGVIYKKKKCQDGVPDCTCTDKELEEPKIRELTEGSESKSGVGKKPMRPKIKVMREGSVNPIKPKASSGQKSKTKKKKGDAK